MASHDELRMRKALRALLLLFGLLVVVSVIIVATHKSPAPLPAATPDRTDSKTTTTAVRATPSAVADRTTTKANFARTTPPVGAERPAVGGKAITLSPGLHLLFDLQGHGDDTVGRFIIGPDATPWDVNWSYNCSELGKKGQFNYTIVFTHGVRPDPNDLGPRQTGMNGTGVEQYHDAGTFGMTVATQCSWTVELSQTGS